MTLALPADFDAITPAWLTNALQRADTTESTRPLTVIAVRWERIGEQTGFLGRLARLYPTYAAGATGPASIIAKLPTLDPGGLEIGRMLGVWPREARFFDEVAATCNARIPLCYFNGADPGADRYVLLLEDCGPAQPADQVLGATDEQAKSAVDALARLHAQWWGVAKPWPWMPGFDRIGDSPLQGAMRSAIPGFILRYGSQVPAHTIAWLAEFVEQFRDWTTGLSTRPLTLVHADYRLDNLLYDEDGEPTMIDWQTALWGPGAMDLASFCSTSLTVADRRRLEPDLLQRYSAGIAAAGHDVSVAEVTDSYRECLLWWMAIFANNLSRLDPQDQRATTLFDLMIERTFVAAADHDAGAVLR